MFFLKCIILNFFIIQTIQIFANHALDRVVAADSRRSGYYNTQPNDVKIPSETDGINVELAKKPAKTTATPDQKKQLAQAVMRTATIHGQNRSIQYQDTEADAREQNHFRCLQIIRDISNYLIRNVQDNAQYQCWNNQSLFEHRVQTLFTIETENNLTELQRLCGITQHNFIAWFGEAIFDSSSGLSTGLSKENAWHWHDHDVIPNVKQAGGSSAAAAELLEGDRISAVPITKIKNPAPRSFKHFNHFKPQPTASKPVQPTPNAAALPSSSSVTTAAAFPNDDGEVTMPQLTNMPSQFFDTEKPAVQQQTVAAAQSEEYPPLVEQPPTDALYHDNLIINGRQQLVYITPTRIMLPNSTILNFNSAFLKYESLLDAKTMQGSTQPLTKPIIDEFVKLPAEFENFENGTYKFILRNSEIFYTTKGNIDVSEELQREYKKFTKFRKRLDDELKKQYTPPEERGASSRSNATWHGNGSGRRRLY